MKLELFILFSFFIYIKPILYEDGDYWFPFPSVSMNYSDNNVLDLSYLNWKIEERIKIKDGHFYYKDKRVKFLGVNLPFDLFGKEESPIITKRMAQLGINIVRIIRLDNKDIWLNNTNSTLDKIQLDKLHYLLYCLKQNGIYASIPLHAKRKYPEIEFNKTILNKFQAGRGIDRFYPIFIDDQKNYARDLLTSFNNYTNFRIGDDPMLLNIELNNENSMFYLWGDENFNSLTNKMKEELISQWRKYLKINYKSYEELYKYYNGEIINRDNNIIENNTLLFQKDNAIYNYDQKNNIISFNITSIPSVPYGNQVKYGFINISNSSYYTIEFDAKAKISTNDTLEFLFQESQSPYKGYLKIKNIKLSTEFKHYSFISLTEDNCQTLGAKIIPKIIFPPSINYYEIKNFKIFKGQEEIIIAENNIKSLDKIFYPNDTLLNKIPNMAYDLRLFFKNTEINTQKTLTNYIKNELNFRNIFIFDSQVDFGSIFSSERESELSDIIDIHGYWQHPSWPKGHEWDRNYYSIENTPMIKSSFFGTLGMITCEKIYNKPFTISEYYHPFPNEHLHEKFAMLGSWASFHDFDGIYQYSYEINKDEYIKNYFDMASNSIDFAMTPYITFAFRNNYIKKSKNYVKVKINKGFLNFKMKETTYKMYYFLLNHYY